MADALFVLTVVAFFAAAVLYVHACAGMVGAGTAEPSAEVDEDEAVAA